MNKLKKHWTLLAITVKTVFAVLPTLFALGVRISLWRIHTQRPMFCSTETFSCFNSLSHELLQLNQVFWLSFLQEILVASLSLFIRHQCVQLLPDKFYPLYLYSVPEKSLCLQEWWQSTKWPNWSNIMPRQCFPVSLPQLPAAWFHLSCFSVQISTRGNANRRKANHNALVG